MAVLTSSGSRQHRGRPPVPQHRPAEHGHPCHARRLPRRQRRVGVAPRPAVGAARTQSSAGATITYDDVVGVQRQPDAVAPLPREARHRPGADLQPRRLRRAGHRVQVDAVARGAEDLLAAAMNGLSSEVAFATTATEADTLAKLLVRPRQRLSAANVPAGDRYLAVSPDIATRLLSLAGPARTWTAPATTARCVRRPSATSSASPSWSPTPSPPAPRWPTTAPRSPSPTSCPPPRVARRTRATATFGGVGLRHIFQYQPDILSDASVVSTFAGAALVDGARVVKMTTT